jgi:hypothetical protein
MPYNLIDAENIMYTWLLIASRTNQSTLLKITGHQAIGINLIIRKRPELIRA